MKTHAECLKCFVRQAEDACRLNELDAAFGKKVVEEVSRALPDISAGMTPPEIARTVYGIVEERSGKKDPYKDLKDKSNRMALKLYPELKKRVDGARDRLLAAVRLAVAGNVIDYGLPHVFDIEKEIEECLEKPFAVFDYDGFRKAVSDAGRILYILDNAGEIVLDRLLIETMGKDVVAAVRSRAIINDVTLDDAHYVGLDKICTVIPSGSDMPGTVISRCGEEFRRYYEEADLIISKGQGNYETLSDEKRPIYFIFKAKCAVVARHVGCRLGDMILKRRSPDR